VHLLVSEQYIDSIKHDATIKVIKKSVYALFVYYISVQRNILVYTGRGGSREGAHVTRPTPRIIDLCVNITAFISEGISAKMSK